MSAPLFAAFPSFWSGLVFCLVAGGPFAFGHGGKMEGGKQQRWRFGRAGSGLAGNKQNNSKGNTLVEGGGGEGQKMCLAIFLH